MKSRKIRTLALCVLEEGDWLLVGEGHDPVTGKPYYRPLGGLIDFGERAAAAAAREIEEELGAQVTDLRYLGTLENLFIDGGKPGHEIVLAFAGRFVDRSLSERPWLPRLDKRNARAVWVSLAELKGAPPLYPEGFLELLAADRRADD